MTATIPTQSSQYHPATTEAKWQKAWEEHQVFQADPDRGGEPYCIVIPPPNVTGSLHMGHAFESSLIDVLVRYHRMIGRNTLWLPGTDHASIAVQTILEKQLKAEGKSGNDLGREEFLKRAWQWKAESGGTIVNQLQRLGVSVDWSRERFTMDEGLSKAVLEAFVKLYQEGLIYRGNYMVNWCPATQSAVSDLEVENQEVNGHLWHFRYPLADGSGSVEVATTRPETMLGDTAVAVHPQDDRYRHLIGKTVMLPILNREIPIIGDQLVDPEFGTGCVKVTPAHDPNDFQMGQRHDLPLINILNKDGSLNENAGPFQGQDRFVARQQVVEQLEAEGRLVKVEDYRHTVPYSDRGKVPVEPLLSTQWFVKIQPLAAQALTFLDQQHSPNFVPERWTKVYRDWITSLQDWCISRQLWWGHQIPAWYAVSETAGQITDDTPFIVARTAAEAHSQAIAKFGAEVQLVQDPDVLDTWFSAGLWPFSTLGWPDQTADLAYYYPTSTLVTGFDIIFFWVARMTMMAGHFTRQMPFQDVYIHGLVRDENNKKMSKSANNGIDPLILIDKYGTDALRYTLIREVAGAGQDIRLEYDRQTDESASVEASRNFANKLWNASRFVMLNLEGQTPEQLGAPFSNNALGKIETWELSDRWILSRYHQVVRQTRDAIDNYGLGEAAKGLYEFIWRDFCDWYIELVKSRLQGQDPVSRRTAQQTLAYVLEGTLKLLHPFMPHITEEIWHTLTQQGEDQFLALQSYPETEQVGVKVAKPKVETDVQSASRPTEPSPSKQFSTQVSQSWSQSGRRLFELPDELGKFFGNYSRQLIVVGLFLVALFTLQLALAVDNTLHHLPLVAPLFELIGLGYTIGLIYRHLIWAANRQALVNTIQSLQEQIFGKIDIPRSSGKAEVPESPPLPTAPAQMDQTPQPSALNAQPSNPENPVLQSSTEVYTSLINPNLEQEFERVIGTIRTIRNLRAEAGIKPGAKIEVILQTQSDRERQILKAGQSYVRDLARIESLTITSALAPELKQTIVGVVGTIQVLIPLAGVVDVMTLRTKVQKDLSKAEAEAKSLSTRLSNASFVDKAPADVVQGARDALAKAKKQAEILRDRLDRL